MERVGKYELVQKIATGGMAEVFLAKTAGPMGFEKALVVKRILPHLVQEPEFINMFLSEAKLAACLNHHNVVQIFDFGETDGVYFLAMELIDGTNLRVLSKRAQELQRPIPFPVCAKIAALACEGLAYAHDLTDPATGEPLNVVHRDISPDNIMVTRTGGVKVVDFGIAKAASQSHRTSSGIVKGKLAYMPPEQIAAKSLDRRTDVYAMGVVLYNLLTGTKPYDVESDISLMHAILTESPVRVRVRRPEVPEALEKIVEKAMEHDLLRRYQSCLEMQADLERYLRTCDTAAGSHEIAALVAELGPPPLHLPGSGTPVGAKTPRPSGPREALPAPQTTTVPTKQESTERTARTQEWSPAVGSVSPEPAPPASSKRVNEGRQKQPKLRMRVVAGVLAAGAILLGVAIPLLSHRNQSSSDPQEVKPPVPAVAQALPMKETESPRQETTATPPPPAPMKSASVIVRSTPPGNLRVNGKLAGRTPMQVTDLPAGEVKFEVFGDDFSKEQRFVLEPGDNGTKQITLGHGTIEFRVQPYAIITLDDQELGPTPLPPVKVYEGEHRARFSNPTMHKAATRQIRVKAGEYKIYPITLE